MGRFTLVKSSEPIKRYTATKGPGEGGLSRFYESLKKSLEEVEVYVAYDILPGFSLILSNGVKKEKHLELYEQVNARYPGTRIVSVVHENPLYAVMKAFRIMKQTDFYYEEGVEREYYIGYFTPIEDLEDILSGLFHRVNTIYNVTLLLLNSGSLPLEISTTGVLAVLNENITSQLEYIKTRVHLKIGVDYNASKAVEKALLSNN